MPTYQAPDLPVNDRPIPEEVLDYFRRHLRHELHELIVRAFDRQKQDPRMGLTKKKLAERIRKRPERITRLLGKPGNLRVDTLSDLLVGMGIDPRTPFAYLIDSVDQHREDSSRTITTDIIIASDWRSIDLNAVASDWTCDWTYIVPNVKQTAQAQSKVYLPAFVPKEPEGRYH
jgi:hypothetical protein